MSKHSLSLFFAIISALLFQLPQKAMSVQPIRLAIVAGSDSGIEQELADSISRQFDNDSTVVLSTINPDWYVLCNITDKQDRMGGQIRYNGTVTVKTLDGQIVSTVSAQKYTQDFSLQPGAPLNKQLVDSSARELIGGLSNRATPKLKEAVQAELKAREQIKKAEILANENKYDQAIITLEVLGQDTVHFQSNQKLIAQYEMEKHSLQLMHNAELKAKQKRYREAIVLLKEIEPRSKQHQAALQLISRYKALLH